MVAGRSLMPDNPVRHCQALRLIGLGLEAAKKSGQIVYEQARPADKQHAPVLERANAQLEAAWSTLEGELARYHPETGGPDQVGITTAVVWRFAEFALPGLIDRSRFPVLCRWSDAAEALPAFVATPLE